jgi:hypothetical protein
MRQPCVHLTPHIPSVVIVSRHPPGDREARACTVELYDIVLCRHLSSSRRVDRA